MGFKVGRSQPGGFSKLKLCSKRANTRKSSSRAKDSPKQTRRPAENGRKRSAFGGTKLPSSSRNLSGLKVPGSSQISGSWWRDHNLIMTMAEVFMAGLETTASTLCWALLYLIHNPGVQQMLHQELDQVIGPERLPELEDKKNLPYLEATITETLRLSSLVPLSVPHKTTVDTTLQGYSIPKGTTVLMNLSSVRNSLTDESSSSASFFAFNSASVRS